MHRHALAALLALGCTADVPDPAPITLPDDLDAWLAGGEAAFSDITPRTEKTIVWATAKKTRTPVSLIYLHGYSATRQEISPVMENVAARLGANLYLTRLKGHGRTGQAMAEASMADWLTDAREALTIGHRLGERVVIVGTSTGGTLATWLASRPWATDVSALVLISPNFGPKDPKAKLLTLPGRELFVPLVAGDERSWEPHNDEQARYWTHSYPIQALYPMMDLVSLVDGMDLSALAVPTLVMSSPDDAVISFDRVAERFEELGGQPKELVEVMNSADPSDHVLAGRVLSPGTVDETVERILGFVSRAE